MKNEIVENHVETAANKLHDVTALRLDKTLSRNSPRFS
jgi:hypothetical protein